MSNTQCPPQSQITLEWELKSFLQGDDYPVKVDHESETTPYFYWIIMNHLLWTSSLLLITSPWVGWRSDMELL